MKQTKRILSVVLCLVMVLCAVPVMEASAVCCRKDYFDKSRYTLTGDMAQDVATIAKSQKGMTCSDFGYSGVDYGAWCDEFVADCLENAGADDSIVAHGGTVADFESKMRDRGAYTVSSPKAGDLVFFTWSHVEIVTKVEDGVPYCAGGNNGSSPGSCKGERKISSVGSVRLYLRPNYPDHPSYADLGDDFYAVILNTKHWKPISLNTSTDEITLESEGNVAYQKWRFRRQDDGAYRIESCANGKVLEMTNGERENRTQLTAHDDWWGGYYQQWYLIPQGDGYVFQSKHFTGDNWVMDLRGSSDADGSVIQIYQRNDDYADDETWSVYKGDDVQLKRPNLTVKAGSSLTKTTFTWNSIYGSMRYDVKIWKNKVDHSVDSFHTEWGATSGYSVQLPPGTYEAYVTACDYFQCLGSQDIQFTVQNEVCTHTWNSGAVTKSATCTSTGVKTITCSICGATTTETIPIDSTNHVNTTNVAATASTCTVKGYTAGVYCNDCKKYISGHQEQPLVAHKTELRNQKTADCTTAGYTGDRYCTVCKQTITKGSAISALGHTAPDGNGNCTRCGTHIKDVTPTQPSQPQTNPNACKWCGKVHNGNFFDKLVGFFHSILAIFKR